MRRCRLGRLHDAAPDGVLFSRSVDSGGLNEVMARAHLVLERTFKTARQSALPLEGRGVVAEHDEATGVTTVWTSTQLHSFGAASPTRWAATRTRCGPCSQVGGGFGAEGQPVCGEIAVAALARGLGRPVRWIEDRTENLLAGTHGHDTRVWLRVAVGEDGRVHAIDADVVTDGAYSVWPGTAVVEPATAALSLFGPYALEAIRFRARAVASNRCPVGPCRGIGQNAAVFATEQMMDAIATELGVDPLELRRRNAVRDLPWTSPVGRELDSELPGPAGAAGGGVRLPGVAAAASHRPLGGPVGRHRDLALQRDQRQRLGGLPPSRGHLASRHRRGPGRGDGRGPGGDLHQRRQRRAGDADTGPWRAGLGLRPEEVEVIEGDTALCPDGSGTFISRGAVGVVESVVGGPAHGGQTGPRAWHRRMSMIRRRSIPVAPTSPWWRSTRSAWFPMWCATS